MYDPLAGMANMQWVWPCAQCAGCQSTPEPVAAEVAFGIDWQSAADGTDDHSETVAASDTVVRDFDVSTAPNNTAIVIRLTIMWFQTSGEGAVNLYYETVILAYRDENGDLQCSLNSWGGPTVGVGPAPFQIDDISAPDNDTVRLTLLNLNAETAFVRLRSITSIVTSGGHPVPPPGA